MEPDVKFIPPYNIPWTTFLTAVEKLAADPPTRVDRSYLGSQSGNVQTYLIAALKAFALIDKDSRPDSARLAPFVEPTSRKAAMATLFTEHYGPMVELGRTKTTADELREKFTEVFPSLTGESKIKAIRFFLAGMAYCELPVSDLWKSVKAPRGASGRTTARKTPAKKAGIPAPEHQPREETPASGGALSGEAMRAMYFKLLLQKAENDDGADMLDRIERLVGVQPAGKKPGRPRKTTAKKADEDGGESVPPEDDDEAGES